MFKFITMLSPLMLAGAFSGEKMQTMDLQEQVQVCPKNYSYNGFDTCDCPAPYYGCLKCESKSDFVPDAQCYCAYPYKGCTRCPNDYVPNGINTCGPCKKGYANNRNGYCSELCTGERNSLGCYCPSPVTVWGGINNGARDCSYLGWQGSYYSSGPCGQQTCKCNPKYPYGKYDGCAEEYCCKPKAKPSDCHWSEPWKCL